jgi:hypothetical protein
MPEENMMSQRSKRELIEEIRPRYLKAKKSKKKSMLDEFVAATGYHRKYATRLLKHGRPRRSNKKHGLRKVYQGEVVVALEQIWEVCGRICSKRLHPFLPEMVKVLERCGELRLPDQTKALLLRMSRSTIDRCLGPVRFKHPAHGLSTTRPGSLLKKAIPVRTFTPWDEDHPGFLEIDLVAHCGETTEGQYLNTLTCVDLSTGWIECLAVRKHTQQAVFEAIQAMRTYLPFLLLGIDSDNGGEFIWTTYSTATVSPKRSPLPARALTRKMTRPMSSKRTGPSSAASSVMIASRLKKNTCFSKVSTQTCAYMPTSSNQF